MKTFISHKSSTQYLIIGLIFIIAIGKFSYAQEQIQQTQLDSIQNSVANIAQINPCLNGIYSNILANGVTDQLKTALGNQADSIITGYKLLSTSYFNQNQFNCTTWRGNYIYNDSISDFISRSYSSLSEEAEKLLGGNSNTFSNCFYSVPVDVDGQAAKDVIAQLTAYACNPSSDTLTSLNNILNNYDSHLQQIIDQNNQLNFALTGDPSLISQGDPEDETCIITGEQSPCALAPTLGWLNPVNSAIGALFYGIYLIMRGFLVWTLKIFEWLLNPINYNGYIHFLKTDIVNTLFKQFRNLAYLGIIIGSIIAAIATILGSEKYNWQKLLPKILLVALLVNFSLVICGIFVDISNYLSVSFFYAGISVLRNIKITLSNLLVNCTICPVVSSFYYLGGPFYSPGGAWNLVRATGLGILLTSLFFFQFGGLVLYVAKRILTIIICLITSPLAILSVAIPGGEGLFNFWRKNFQQAIVVLPILAFAFSVSLSLLTAIALNISQNINPSKFESHIFLTSIAYLVFVLGLAQVTRYVANFLGVEEVEKGFQKLKNATITAAKIALGAAAGFVGAKFVASGGWQTTQKTLLSSDNLLKQNIGKWMKISSDRILIPRYGGIKEAVKEEPDNMIRTRLKTSFALGDQARSAQFINVLANRKKLDEKEDLPIITQLIKSGSPLLDRKILKDNYPQIEKMINSIEKAKETAQANKQKFDISSSEIPEYYKKGIEAAINDIIIKPRNELKDINWKAVFSKFDDPVYKDIYLNQFWNYLNDPQYKDISLTIKVSKIATIISRLPETLAGNVMKELSDKIKSAPIGPKEKQEIINQFKAMKFLRTYFS